MNREKIMRASGNLYIADVVATALEQLRPHSEAHRKLVEKMKADLIVIRNAEGAIADREAEHP